MMKSNTTFSLSRMTAIVQALVLVSAMLLPVLLMQGRTSAATIQNRYIDMSSVLSSGGNSTNGSGRDGGDTAGQNVTYTVGFDMPATGNVGAIVVEFCNDTAGGPIVLQTCTAPTGLNVNTGTAIANQNGISGFTKIASVVPAANRFGIENGTPQSITSNTTDTTTVDGRTYPASDVKFDITGITNPTVLGTFYARIIVYDDNADLPSTSWVSTSTNTTNGIGTRVHDGGTALSVANHLTVTARVQEVLQFCIGTETDSAASLSTRDTTDDCTDISGTDLDLGVVDSNSIQRTSDGDINNDGLAMVRTNGIDGVAVFYKAEQETGLSNGGAGALRIAGVDDCGTISAVNNACFNSAGGNVTNPSQSAITAGTELFGMTLTNLDTTTGGATTALSCNSNYDGDGSCGSGAASGYAWDPTEAFDTIATATGPIDDEMVNIEFAATASPTTPTGLYTVTANFVATAQF
jgi:hypothetical protein